MNALLSTGPNSAMESTVLLPSHEAHLQHSLISLAQLSPDLENPAQYSFQAVVTLVWPFSSSNRAFSLLLAEPDYRLRQQIGRVRVTFRGKCAEEVARTKIGIGDKVKLSLEGAQWIENKNVLSTPGKSLGWELQFTNRVKLEVYGAFTVMGISTNSVVPKAVRNSLQIATVDVDHPPPPDENTVPASPTTPALNSSNGLTDDLAWKDRWETPAFLRSKRLASGSPIQTGFGLFAEEDGYIPGRGRKRPRFSFPSSKWRLVDEPDKDEPSNEDNWFESDEEELLRDDEQSQISAFEADGVEDSKPTKQTHALSSTPTPKISVEIPEDDSVPIQVMTPREDISGAGLVDKQSPLPTDTPRLHPLASPSLPTPSPIVSTPTQSLGYFSADSSQVPSSQFLAPTTTPAHQFDNHTSSNSTSADDVFPRSSATSSFDVGLQGTSAPGTESNSQFQFSSQTTNFTATEQDGSLQTFYGAPSEPGFASGFAGESTDLVTEDGEILPIDPAVSQMHKEENDKRQDVVDDDVVMEGESPDRHEYQYQDATEKASEVERFEVEDMGLPHEGQLNRNWRDATGSPSELQSENDADAPLDEQYPQDSEDSEFGSVRHESYNSQIDEDEIVSGGFVSDGMEEEDENGDQKVEEDEEMSEELHDDLEFDSEIEDESYETPVQQSKPPPRNVYPEVIVLDSDSEDEGAQPIIQSSIQNDDEPDDEHSDVSSNMSENPGYESVEEEEEADQEVEATSEAENEYNGEDYLHYTSADNEKARDEERLVDDQPIQIEDDELSVVDNDDEILIQQQNDLSSDRPTSIEPSEASVQSDQLSVRSTSKVTYHISASAEDAVYLSDGKEDPGVSVIKDRSAESSPHTIRLEHESRPLVTRLKSLPTPQATQDEESNHASPDSQADVPGEKRPSPDGTASDEHKAPPESNRHQWTDGSEDKNSPQILDALAEIPEDDVDGHTAEDHAEPGVLDEVVLMEDHSTRESADSEGQALEATETPHERDTPTPGLRTGKTTYPTLVTLMDRINEIVDTISMVVDVSSVERATSGSKDYYLTLRVTDATMAGTTIEVHISHPDQACLPPVSESDVIVFRNFKVQKLDHSTTLLSCANSACAVLSAGSDEPHITGPPFEFGEDERRRVQELQAWYNSGGGHAMAADHMLQLSINQEQKEHHSPSSVASSSSLESAAAAGPSPRPRPRRKKSHRRITIHELRDGRRYTEAGSPDNESIHELRDGTVYWHSFERD